MPARSQPSRAYSGSALSVQSQRTGTAAAIANASTRRTSAVAWPRPRNPGRTKHPGEPGRKVRPHVEVPSHQARRADGLAVVEQDECFFRTHWRPEDQGRHLLDRVAARAAEEGVHPPLGNQGRQFGIAGHGDDVTARAIGPQRGCHCWPALEPGRRAGMGVWLPVRGRPTRPFFLPCHCCATASAGMCRGHTDCVTSTAAACTVTTSPTQPGHPRCAQTPAGSTPPRLPPM